MFGHGDKGSDARDGVRSYGRPLTRRLYALPFVLLVVVWVARTAESDFPLVVKLAFGAFVIALCTLAVREGLRSGIEISDAGVTVVSFMRKRFVRWSEVAGFETARRGTYCDVVVVCSNGTRLRAIGFRAFSGDPRVLEPYVAALVREQTSAAANQGRA